MKKNIVLIGFMGTGKSAVGRRLAKELNYHFVDIDQDIELLVGMKIKDIFRLYGEKRFRSEEELMIQKLSSTINTVISAGGGVVLNNKNVISLRNHAVLIELQADPDVILERVKKNNNRPLVQGASLEDIEASYAMRRPLYAVADFHIDTSHQSIDDTVEEIVLMLKSRKEMDE